MSWERLESTATPTWVRKHATEQRNRDPYVAGTAEVVHGDTFVYKIEYAFGNHGHEFRYHRQLKHEYFDTTPKKGTCPNCQQFVRRQSGDDVLTCHRCGWEYTPSIGTRLRSLLSI